MKNIRIKEIFRDNDDLRYDFLPSDLEIIERPASPLGKAIIYIISIFIFTMILMCCIAKIDKVVVASGQVHSVDGIKIVDSNLNGKIVEINKSEGDIVKEGEVILKIDNYSSSKKKEEITETLETYKLQLDLVNSRIDMKYDEGIYEKYNLPSETIEAIKLEYNVEQEGLTKQQESFNNTLDQLSHNKSKLQKQIEELNSMYESIADNNDMKEEKTGILNTITSCESQIEKIDTELQSKEEAKEIEKNKIKLEYITKRSAIEAKIKELESSLDNLDNESSNYIVTSPVNGTIFKLNYNTVNSYVNQSRPIAEIVPDNAEYEIESYIQNADISRIQIDQDVVIKIEAYDYQKYGTLSGKVSYISPDSFNNENMGIVYKIKIKFDPEENEVIKLLPGMNGSIEIKSGEIRLIEYFIEPFMKNIENGLKG